MTEDSAAKKRAAARREAILNSRGNRLAKLTSSARGEEAAALYDGTRLYHALEYEAYILGWSQILRYPRYDRRQHHQTCLETTHLKCHGVTYRDLQAIRQLLHLRLPR